MAIGKCPIYARNFGQRLPGSGVVFCLSVYVAVDLVGFNPMVVLIDDYSALSEMIRNPHISHREKD